MIRATLCVMVIILVACSIQGPKKFLSKKFGNIESIPDSVKTKLAFQMFEKAKKCYATEKKKGCEQMMQDAYELSDQHSYFIQEIVDFFIMEEDYKEATRYLRRLNTETLSYAVRSRYYFFRGILEYKEGCSSFTDAYYSFKSAAYLENKREYPNAEHLSMVYNAMGVMKMVFGATSKTGPKDDSYNIWITKDIQNALVLFKKSLYYNPDNIDALNNRDSLTAKVEEGNIPIDFDTIMLENMIQAYSDTTESTEFDINASDKIDTLDEVNIAYLPGNRKLILDALKKYDELLVVGDISGSMTLRQPSKGVSRFTIMKETVLYLASNLNNKLKMGMISVGGSCNGSALLDHPVSSITRVGLLNEVKSLYPNGGTPLIKTLRKAKWKFDTEKTNQKALLLISDGLNSCYENNLDLCLLAEELHSFGIDIHIISFIVEGMWEYEYAYELYNCMIKVDHGSLYELQDDGEFKDKYEGDDDIFDSFLLPSIKVGEDLNMNYLKIYHKELCN